MLSTRKIIYSWPNNSTVNCYDSANSSKFPNFHISITYYILSVFLKGNVLNVVGSTLLLQFSTYPGCSFTPIKGTIYLITFKIRQGTYKLLKRICKFNLCIYKYLGSLKIRIKTLPLPHRDFISGEYVVQPKQNTEAWLLSSEPR